MLLKPFIEKLTWYLYGQNLLLDFDRFYRKKPGLETLIIDIIFNYF